MVQKNLKKYSLKGKKCKKCGYRMTKLYRQSNRKDEKKRWIPVVWYCVDCDRLGDRIR